MSKPIKNNEISGTLTPETGGQGSVKVPEANLDAFKYRMKLLIEHFKPQGGVAEVARRCGYSEAVIRSWRDGGSDPSRGRCVQLAATTGVSLEWLAAGIGDMWPSAETPEKQGDSGESHVLRQTRLTLALQAVEDALASRRAWLPAEKRAEAAMLVYELLGTGLPEAEIIPIARRAVALGAEKGDGEDDGRTTGAAAGR